MKFLMFVLLAMLGFVATLAEYQVADETINKNKILNTKSDGPSGRLFFNKFFGKKQKPTIIPIIITRPDTDPVTEIDTPTTADITTPTVTTISDPETVDTNPIDTATPVDTNTPVDPANPDDVTNPPTPVDPADPADPVDPMRRLRLRTNKRNQVITFTLPAKYRGQRIVLQGTNVSRPRKRRVVRRRKNRRPSKKNKKNKRRRFIKA